MHAFPANRFLLISLLACMAGTGCSHTKLAECEENKASYLRADNHAALQLPDGNQANAHTGALSIPPGNNQNINTKACLDRPPAYFGTAGRLAASPEETVADWAQAWADRNATAVVAMYSSQFRVDGADSKTWLAQRASEVASGAAAGPRVRQLKVGSTGNDERTASFTQVFGTQGINKQVILIRENGVWKISSERVLGTITLKKS